MKIAKEVMWLVMCGFIVMVGLRAAEWLIPEPPSRIVICYGSDGKEPVCLPMDELALRIKRIQESGE